MTLRAAMVLTTIADPVVLFFYFWEFCGARPPRGLRYRHSRQENPAQLSSRCADLRNRGLDVALPHAGTAGNAHCAAWDSLRISCPRFDNRRNVGYLMAAEAGGRFPDLDLTTITTARHTRISSPSIQSFVASRSGMRPDSINAEYL